MKSLIITICFLGVSFIGCSQIIALDEIKCRVSKDDVKALKGMIKFQSYYYKPFFKDELKTIKIKVFGKYKQYIKVRQSMTIVNVDGSTGFYSGRTKTIYVYKDENYISTLYHEVNHAIMHQISGHLPTWINEGMAVFFQSFKFKYTGLSKTLQRRHLSKTRKWILEKKVNLRDLLNYSHLEWYKKNNNPRGYSYLVSYSFVCYLYFRYPESINLILKKLKEGKNSIEAIEYITKQDFKFIENDFYTYIKEYYYLDLLNLKWVN